MKTFKKFQNLLASNLWRITTATIASSLAACIGGLLFLTFLSSAISGKYTVSVADAISTQLLLLVIILPIAVLVILFIVIPITAVIRYFYMAKLSLDITVFHAIIGICFLVLATTIFTAISMLELLIIPAAALPSGFVFHSFMKK